MRLYIGTSGFQYQHWNNGVFYPRGIKDRMAYALERMNALEINSTFYSIPRPDAVAGWSERIPPDAKLVLKAPRSVSHRRRLKLHSDPKVRQGVDLLNYFLDGFLRIPERNRGPALLQLPGSMEIDLDRLEPVLQVFAARGVPVALEIRHASWFCADTLDLLERYGSAMVASDWKEFDTPLTVTADFIYIRRHGPGARYDSCYDEASLRADLDLLRRQKVSDAYVFFNNDGHGYAPRNAMRLIEMAAEECVASA